MTGDKIHQDFINHLRNASKKSQAAASRQPQCPSCEAPITDLAQFRRHVQDDVTRHPDLGSEAAVDEAFRNLKIDKPPLSSRAGEQSQAASRTAKKRPNPAAPETSGGGERESIEMTAVSPEDTERGSKKICSPAPSDTQQRGSSSPTPTPTPRSRARPNSDLDFSRGTSRQGSSRQLYDPNDANIPQVAKAPFSRTAPKPSSRHNKHPPQRPSHGRQENVEVPIAGGSARTVDPERPNQFLEPQPETKQISLDQLVTEVKAIYVGLAMIEAKCIEVDGAQSSAKDHQLSGEQMLALIALHRTLLHEHHDFFLASQHPAANAALRRLPSKYSMPARMWRHGIHSFLELLRHGLPESYEHMLTFIYLAYSMMTLLLETVPAFRDTWIECLGDLGRYRMAIEDNDLKDREIWTGVSRYWYSRASEKAPTTGRLYHHLAILARPNALQQLFYYTKSLAVPIPFASAKESIMTLFDPLLESPTTRLAPADAAFVRVNGMLFSGKNIEQLDSTMKEYLDILDAHIARTRKWYEPGYYSAIAIACSLIGYGKDGHILLKALSQSAAETDVKMDEGADSEVELDEMFIKTRSFAFATYEIIVRRWGDPSTLPFLHCMLVFIFALSRRPAAMAHIESHFPWKLTEIILNYLYHTCETEPRMDSETFPGAPKKSQPRPLPEDFALRGLLYADEYLPDTWFTDSEVEEDEKHFELPSMTDERKERLLWLGRRIAISGRWLTWDEATRKFGVAEAYATEAEDMTFEILANTSEGDHDPQMTPSSSATPGEMTHSQPSTPGGIPHWDARSGDISD